MQWGCCFGVPDCTVEVNSLCPLVFLHVTSDVKLYVPLGWVWEQHFTEASTSPRKSSSQCITRLRKHWQDSFLVHSSYIDLIELLLFYIVYFLFCFVLFFLCLWTLCKSEIKSESTVWEVNSSKQESNYKISKKLWGYGFYCLISFFLSIA